MQPCTISKGLAYIITLYTITSLGATGLFSMGGGLIAGLPLNTMIIHTFSLQYSMYVS